MSTAAPWPAAFDPHEVWDGQGPDPGDMPEDLSPIAMDLVEDERDAAVESGDKPVVEVRVGELGNQVRGGIKALRGASDIYERDYGLVHVTYASAEEQSATATQDEHGRDRFEIIAGTPKIHSMTPATLKVRLSDCATWKRWDERAKALTRCAVPRDVVEAIADAKTYPGLRSLKGFIESPSFRPNGSVLDTPGWDRATGYLYVPSAKFRPVAKNPTRDDGRRSHEALAKLFDDFPYALPAGRSMVVSAVLTLLARPAINGPTPAFIFDATTPGSGKTLQVDVCSAIATGREAGRSHFPFTSGRDRDTELSKVLASLARRGASMVNFDNLDAGSGSFGGSSIEMCITSRDSYTFRILGKTEDLTVAWRTVVLGSGNNVDWTRDMGRRILVARLESPFEDPENRPVDTYKHPELAGRLLDHVLEHRVDYVHHGLTLLRAYFAAGGPLPSGFQRWGSFERWSEVIAGALIWVGADDPMLCRPSQQADESPDKTQHRNLVRELDAFCRASGQRSITVAALLSALYPKDERGGSHDPRWEDLRGAIEHFAAPRPGCSPDQQAVGCAIKRHKGAAIKIGDGPARRLVPDGTTGGKVRWKVEDVPAIRLEGDP